MVASPSQAERILVWDLPTRLFHWLLVVAFFAAYVSGDVESWLLAHSLFGYTVLGLVAFRLVWGLIGTRYARFASFAFGPAQVARYLASLLTPRPQHYLGHNPAGSWAMYALLALAVLSGLTGWLALEEIGGEWLEDLHEGAANLMLAIVLVHIAGALVSSWLHGENLVRSMIDGRKRGSPDEGLRSPFNSIGIVLLAALLAFWTAALRGDLPSLTQPAVERQHDEEDDDDD